MKLRLLFSFVLACFLSAPAQLSSPNAAGVSMGQVHLLVRDLDANTTFFKLLGGTPVQNGSLHLIQFPGEFVILEKGEPSGGSIGSIINHFGFQVRSMNDWLPKWKAAGIKIESMSRPTQAYLLTPDDVRVEILEEPSLSTPIAAHHIHFFTQDVPGMQAWYVKTFSAVPGTRAQFQTANLPGIDLSLSPSQTATLPTRGRALDAIGFEVRDLPGFLTKLQAAGIKLDQPLTKIPGTSIGSASLTDPWGTSIVLTEASPTSDQRLSLRPTPPRRRPPTSTSHRE